MKKTLRLVVFWILMFLAACGEKAPVETAAPTETPGPVISFMNPLDGAAVDYDDLRFQVNPVPGAEGYAWTFIQNGNVVWDTLKDEQRLTDTEYSVPDTGSLNDKFSPGTLQVQVKTRIKGVWTEPATIQVYLPARAIANIPTNIQTSITNTARPTKIPATKEPAPTITLKPSARQQFLAIARNWQIAYYDNDKPCFVQGDGSNPSCPDFPWSYYYVNAGEYPAWAPDGKSILFSLDDHEDIHMNLCVQPIDGGQMNCLTKNHKTSIMFFDPAWSPNGSQIVYSSTQAQLPLGQWWAEDIYTARANGKDSQKLTDSKSRNRHPAWSPNGNLIVFESNRTTWESKVDTELYTIKPDGTGIRQLSDSSDGMSALHPAWSPDGQWVVYELSPDPYANTPQYFIRIIKVDGSSQRSVGGPYTSPTFPKWLPDEQYIAFLNKIINLSNNEVFDLGFDSHNGDWLALPSTANPAPTQTPSLLPVFNCAAGWTRLNIGMYAVVSQGDPNRVRSAPSKTAEIIGQLYPGIEALIVEGPVCADGLVYWKVGNSAIPNGSGWTAEGDGKEYWLEPMK